MPSAQTVSNKWGARMGSLFGLDVPPISRVAKDDVLRGDAPKGDVQGASLGKVGTFHIAGNSQELLRTSRNIAQADYAPVKVCALKSGTMVLSREGETDLRLQPGEIAIYDTAMPYQLRFEGQWNCAVMTVSREELSLPNRTLNNAFRQNFPSPGPGLILTQLIETSITKGVANHDSSEFLGHAAIDLLAGMVYEKATPYAPDEALRAAIQSYIRDNLGAANLSVSTVAHAHRMSVRSLHRLFQEEECGVAELIRHLRLDAVRQDLQDPRLKNLNILAIGVRNGIQSQAHLTRIFRERYGISPAAFRRQHAG